MSLSTNHFLPLSSYTSKAKNSRHDGFMKYQWTYGNLDCRLHNNLSFKFIIYKFIIIFYVYDLESTCVCLLFSVM